MRAEDVDAYLRWAWQRGPRKPGSAPHTVDDLWFDMVANFPDVTRDEVISMFADSAAKAGFGMRRAG